MWFWDGRECGGDIVVTLQCLQIATAFYSYAAALVPWHYVCTMYVLRENKKFNVRIA